MEKKAKPLSPSPRTNFNNSHKQIQRGSKTTWAEFLPAWTPTRTQTIAGVLYFPRDEIKSQKSSHLNAASIQAANRWRIPDTHLALYTLLSRGSWNCPMSRLPSWIHSTGWGRVRMEADKGDTLPTFIITVADIIEHLWTRHCCKHFVYI